MKKKLVISTGAGISAESGISTFRDADGLWENHNVMDVCSAEGFMRNPALVHQFTMTGADSCSPAAPTPPIWGSLNLRNGMIPT